MKNLKVWQDKKQVSNEQPEVDDAQNIVDQMSNYIVHFDNLADQQIVPPETNEIEYQEICSIKIINSEKFPLKLQLKQQFKSFLDSGILKKIELPYHQQLFSTIFPQKNARKLTKYLFWLIMTIKFPDSLELEHKPIQSELQEKFNTCYAELFLKIPKNNKADEVINILMFSFCYIVHWKYFLLFPYNKQDLNMRFLLDCYHIEFFQTLGIYVSDAYLMNSFEKIFTNKFLSYEKEGHPILVRKKHKAIENNAQQNSINRFINVDQIQEQLTEDIVQFMDQLQKRLWSNKKSKALAHQRESKGIIDKKNVIIDKKSPSLEQSETIAQNRFRDYFNCNQISPPIQNYLHLQKQILQEKSQKIIKHQFEKIDVSNKIRSLIAQYKKDTEDAMISKKEAAKLTRQLVKSILTIYDVKADYDEKGMQHPNFFKDMEDLQMILKKYQLGTCQWWSSEKVLKSHHEHFMEQVLKKQKVFPQTEKAQIKKVINFPKIAVDVKFPHIAPQAQSFGKISTGKLQITQLLTPLMTLSHKDKLAVLKNHSVLPHTNVHQILEEQDDDDDGRTLSVIVQAGCQRQVNASSLAVQASEKIDNQIFAKNDKIMYKKKQPEYRKKYSNLARLTTDIKIDRIVQQLQSQRENLPDALENAERSYLTNIYSQKKKKEDNIQSLLLPNNGQGMTSISRLQSDENHPEQLKAQQTQTLDLVSQKSQILQSMNSIDGMTKSIKIK